MPHVLFATNEDEKLQTWLCCPELYYPGCSSRMWEHDIGILYEQCLRPALIPHCDNFDRTFWKRPFDKLNVHQHLSWCKMQKKFVVVKREKLGHFIEALKPLLDAAPLFHGSYFVHEYLHSEAPHSNNFAEQSKAWKTLTKLLANTSSEALRMWTVDLELKFELKNHILLWQPRATGDILSEIFADAEEHDLEDLERKPSDKFPGATEWSAERVDFDSRQVEGDHGIQRISIGSEDCIYMRQQLFWTRYTPEDLFPDNIERLQKSLQHLEDGLYLAALRAEKQGTNDNKVS